MTGNYHDIARFFESVAKLPRIMNIENISISKADSSESSKTLLTVSCIIKTYMFLEKKNEEKK